MTTSLKALNDLGYVLECVAEEYFGDAKTSLALLCDKIQNDPEYGVSDLDRTLVALRYARLCFFGTDTRREGVRIVCDTHRKLWNTLIDY